MPKRSVSPPSLLGMNDGVLLSRGQISLRVAVAPTEAAGGTLVLWLAT